MPARVLNRWRRDREERDKLLKRSLQDLVAQAKRRLRERHMELLSWIHFFDISTSKQIIKLVFRSNLDTGEPIKYANTIGNRHLKDLYMLGCVDRFAVEVGPNEGSCPAHFVLDRVGAIILGIEHFKKRSYIPSNLEHRMMTNDIYVLYQLGASIISWQTEYVIRFRLKAEQVIRPDVFIHYRVGKTEKWVFLEIDTTSENIVVLFAKIKAYVKYVISEAYKRDKYQNISKYHAYIIPKIIIITKDDPERIRKVSKFIRRILKKVPRGIDIQIVTIENLII